MSLSALSNLVLRIGLAFAFLYPPLAALRDPVSWFAYFPPFLQSLPANQGLLLLHAFGVLEVVIAVWILWGKRIEYPAALAAAMLITIVFFNSAQMDVVFRDLSIAAMAVALAIDAYQKSRKVSPIRTI